MSSLTKEELRNALIAHGVTDVPPQSAKKDELVALYEEHVAPTANGSAEFSSDDEVYLNSSPSKRASAASKASKASNSSKVSKSSSKSPRKKAGDGDGGMVIDGVDIDALDDDELFEKLKENGVEVGPIVASTRPFYKKKLLMVLKGETMNTTNGNGAEFSDNDVTDPETEPEEEKTPAKTSRTSRRSASSKKVSSSSQSPKKSPDAKTISPISSMINNLSGLRQRVTNDELDTGKLTPTPRRSIHSYKVTETTKQVITKNKDGTETRNITKSVERLEDGKVVGGDVKGKRMAMLVKILLLVAIMVAIYFVVINNSDGTLTLDQITNDIKSAVDSGAKKIEEKIPPRDEQIQDNVGQV